MAKHLFLLHLGPEAADLAAMSKGLHLGGIALPDVDRDHFSTPTSRSAAPTRRAGLKRKHVEGSWAKVCRAALQDRSHCFVSMPGFFEATRDQAALALDGLAGMKVVLVSPAASRSSRRQPGPRSSRTTGRTSCPPASTPEQLAAQVARIALIEDQARLDKRLLKISRRRKQGRPAARRLTPRAQWGCQASSSAVRAATALGSLPSARSWIETCSKTSRSELRAAIQTCCRTCAESSYSTASGRRP